MENIDRNTIAVGDKLAIMYHRTKRDLRYGETDNTDLPEFIMLHVVKIGVRTIRCKRDDHSHAQDVSLLRDPKGTSIVQYTGGAYDLPPAALSGTVIAGDDPRIEQATEERMLRARIQEARQQAHRYEENRRKRVNTVLFEVSRPALNASRDTPIDIVKLQQDIHDALDAVIAHDRPVYRYHSGEVGPFVFVLDDGQTPQAKVEYEITQRCFEPHPNFDPEGLSLVSPFEPPRVSHTETVFDAQGNPIEATFSEELVS